MAEMRMFINSVAISEKLNTYDWELPECIGILIISEGLPSFTNASDTINEN